MEALGVATGAKAVSCFENFPLARKSASVGLSTASGTSTSSADCCVAFRASSKKEKQVCSAAAPFGLSGDGLRRSSPASSSSSSSSSRPRFGRREARLTSSPRSAAAAAASAPAPASAPVQSLEGESSLLQDIEMQNLEAETPLLVQQCSDLDWKKLVDDLRSEALHGLQSSGLRALSLKALEKLMESWIHEQMVEGVEHPGEVGEVLAAEGPGWNFEAATSDLRMEANLQAAQMLAKGVDSTFDWETDVAELHQRILLAGGAESSVLRPEQRLWSAWTRMQGQMLEKPDQLFDEAVASSQVNAQGLVSEEHLEARDSKQPAEVVESNSEPRKIKRVDPKSLLSLGAAVATGLAVEGIWLLDAVADEGSTGVIEAASKAPSWLVPAVLIFPPLSYLLFNVYRDRVNPYAKVTDWMFGVVALTIVSNLVMMAVWGVRLY